MILRHTVFSKFCSKKYQKYIFFNDTGQFFTVTIDMLLVVFGVGNLLKIEPVLTKKFLQQDLSPAKLLSFKSYLKAQKVILLNSLNLSNLYPLLLSTALSSCFLYDIFFC